MFTFLPEKIKKQDKLDKTTVLMMLDISDDQGQYSLRRETKEVSPMIAPALLPNKDSLQAEAQGEAPRWCPVDSPS